MNRPIKFRAWGGKENGMKYFTFRDIDPEHTDGKFAYLKWPNGSLFCIDCDDEEHNTMQFTGLIDKSGNEIYEGDRVRLTITLNGEPKKEQLETIKWNVQKAMWSPNRLTFRDTVVEIIGNIYENPELLNL